MNPKAPKSTTMTAGELRAAITSAVDAELERIGTAERESRARIEEAQKEHAAAIAEWRPKAAEARAKLMAAPEPPEPPNLLEERRLAHDLLMERGKLADRRQQAMRESAGRVETEWRTVRPEVAERAAKALEPLWEVLGEVEAWRSLLQAVRSAQEHTDGRRVINGPSARMPKRVDLLDAAALAEGRDIMRPVEFPPRDDRAMSNDVGTGFIRGGS
ncbi:hypothetical protein [Arthrobacter sp. H14]|uniref:hypothetical protein n=1 Tax=Arthrobacter sp. H14 TaxID=1312959 RepID=UPI00047D54B7|nr:hypothetical protein [Arthrobacter sp. H14]